VLFVCTANITRSPAAAALFNNLAIKAGEKWIVASAGTKAFSGARAHIGTIQRLNKRKIPIEGHKSQPVTKKLLSQYRWILVMAAHHRDEIIKLDPSAADKTFCLRTFGLNSPDLITDMPDPTFAPNKLEQQNIEFDELFGILDKEVKRAYEILSDRVVNYEMGPEPD